MMQRMTAQRRVILEELQRSKSHPTADELYGLVRQRLPRISLGTVYRNLDVLSRCGLIRKLDMAGSQARFDATLHDHYHIRCVECGRLEDIEVPAAESLASLEVRGTQFEVTEFRLEFTGVCTACRHVGHQSIGN